MTTNRSIYKKTLQRNYRSDDWDTYKSKIAKKRHKRSIKRGAKFILRKTI